MSGKFVIFASVWLVGQNHMSIVRLHIVGLPYRKDIEGHVSEFLAEAPGHAMTIRPQSGNDNDINAIRAFDWQGRFVGYVSHNDLPTAWGAFQFSGKVSLRGMIVSTNIEHPCAMFECVVPGYDGSRADIYSQKLFLDWKYSGPVLNLPDELDNLDFMMGEIEDRLAEQSDWSEEDFQDFVILTERFAKFSKYDISGELNDYRRNLIQRLRDTSIEELEGIAEELEMSFGRTGRETMGGEVLDFWMRQLQSPETVKQLMVHRKEYDLSTIERELEQFPNSMYYVWQENRDRFISKILYMRIPRKVLWNFVSGIAFYEAMTARNRVYQETMTVQDDAESPIYLSKAKGQKIDMIRTLNVMYEQGRFKGKNGSKLTKKEYFTQMGRTMHVDLSDYDNDLSRSMSDSTKLEKHLKPFEDMKLKMIEIWNSK